MSIDANQILELEKVWTQKVKEIWESFAKENLGYESITAGPPDCFDSGDNHSYCWACPWQHEC